jgi:[ribosomal protein S5]-alanine N-acetyltransferase
MLARKRHLRLETERLTLRLPRHADYRPGRRCATARAIS